MLRGAFVLDAQTPSRNRLHCLALGNAPGHCMHNHSKDPLQRNRDSVVDCFVENPRCYQEDDQHKHSQSNIIHCNRLVIDCLVECELDLDSSVQGKLWHNRQTVVTKYSSRWS